MGSRHDSSSGFVSFPHCAMTAGPVGVLIIFSSVEPLIDPGGEERPILWPGVTGPSTVLAFVLGKELL